jgi:hypothetical protein
MLDVGTGDGEVMNRLLPLNPGVHATLIDPLPDAGNWLWPSLRDRCEVYPSTTVADLAARNLAPFDLILLSDVVHHVHVDRRHAFIEDLAQLVGRNHRTILAIKDVEPGSLKSRFLWFCDRFITGDVKVSFLNRKQMKDLVWTSFPGAPCRETRLQEVNPPNYSLIFVLNDDGTGTAGAQS